MATARKKVLWVDDEIEFLRSHIMFLETRGYAVTPAFNGDDALHILQEKPREFDIVLLDEQMPGKDGLTTLEEIKEQLPDLPVVMVTKSEEERVMEDALGKKIDGYLTKPVNPSQILSVCKRLLDSKKIFSSQIAQRFVRSYSQNRAALQSDLDYDEWARLYESLTRWDLHLEHIEDEGLRQTHAGQRSDANSRFADFVTENYYLWLRDSSQSPPLTPSVIDRFLIPELQGDQRICFMVLDCLRLDQFFAIEHLLKQFYRIDRHYSYSILPSSMTFTRRSLFGGRFPDEIEEKFPGLWTSSRRRKRKNLEEKLLRDKLVAAGLDLKDNLAFCEVRDMKDSQAYLESLDTHCRNKLSALLIDFVPLLIESRSKSVALKDMAPDEGAFRRLTHSWFEHSSTFKILQQLADRHITIVLTSTNGSILCTRGTELYGTEEERPDRYRMGEKVSCDERYALFIPDPARFRLPAPSENAGCIILKENYRFIRHDSFKNYQEQYENTFQHGGISMEEMIVPLAILRPQ